MNQREQSYRRILLILGIFFGFSIILAIRLCRIQIWDHRLMSESANRQRHNVLLSNQLRGVFFDRHGQLLRSIEDHWYLVIERNALNPQDIAKIDIILDAGWFDDFNKQPSIPFWIYPKPLEDFQKKLLAQFNIEGLKMIANINRDDYNQPLAWHLLGLVNRGQGFSGLEYLYNSILYQRDTKAAVFTINDGWRHVIPGLGLRTQNTRNKTAVLLTLDHRIQQIVETVMDQQRMKGAVVILDAGSGDILAMASRPLVDLNNLAASITDADTPFLNRAISAYHPGSIFKLVILAAGLDSGQLNSGDILNDPGYYEAGGKKWYCTSSSGTGHGCLTLTEALAFSCNPVFIEMMVKLRPALVLEYADKFGLGQPCNIGLRDESWGEISSELDLTLGEQANIALGEGNIYTTPLQIVSLIQTIANNGVRSIPRLVAGYINQAGDIQYLPANPGTRVISPDTARKIQTMMAAVVTIGTGSEAGISGTGVAGKTGTAQSGNEADSPQHAWFTGFTPLDHPRYVAVVFCEQGISGGRTAAPIFKEIMEKVIQ
jgi:penicillin-binding protein 2